MFSLFKRKNKIEDDPILKELNRQTEELKEIRKSLENEKTEQSIKKAEDLLKSMGYTDKDLKKIESKSKLKVVKQQTGDLEKSGSLLFLNLGGNYYVYY